MHRSDVKTCWNRLGSWLRHVRGYRFRRMGLTAGELDAVEEQLYTYENSLITDGLHTI